MSTIYSTRAHDQNTYIRYIQFWLTVSHLKPSENVSCDLFMKHLNYSDYYKCNLMFLFSIRKAKNK